MKRKPRLTKKQRKAQQPPRPPVHTHGHDHSHIHCTSCGRHLHDHEFDEPATAAVVACDHGSYFATCVGCVDDTKARLAEHDRTGQPVRVAPAFH